MKTRDILLADEKRVVVQLKGMKIKELERHIKKILLQLGQSNYERVLAVVIKAVPELNANARRFVVLRNLVEEQLPKLDRSAGDMAVIDRLTTLLMLLVSKKFEKILKDQS